MARRPLTQELYDRLVDAFRQNPGNAAYASRMAGCDRRMAARGWEEGWPKSHVIIARPIREVIKDEMISARAERTKLQEQERQAQGLERSKARQDSVKAAAEEGQAVSIARANSIAVGGIIQGILRSLIPLAKALPDLLQKEQLTPKEIMKALGDAAAIVKTGNDAIKCALEIERIRLGEPTAIIGIQSQLEEVTAEEAVEELMAIGRTLQRAVVQTTGSVVSYTRPDGSIDINLPNEAFDDGTEDENAEVIELHPGKRRKRQGGSRHGKR